MKTQPDDPHRGQSAQRQTTAVLHFEPYRLDVENERLWQQQGQGTEAARRLEEIYNWFREGFDTADLQNAKSLLAELS